MRLLLIDNFDSFVYNLAQAFGALGAEVVVVRNDASLEDLAALDPAGVVVSPGPGAPEATGVSLEAIRSFGSRVPVLGVCLGHQCIAAAYGATVERGDINEHEFISADAPRPRRVAASLSRCNRLFDVHWKDNDS